MKCFTALALAAGFAFASPAGAQQASPSARPSASAETPAKADYKADASWLCRPGRKDACAVDLSTTVVSADGTLAPEPFTPNPNAPIDCFYVYPTVSTDQTENSDMTADPAELNVVRTQFARFASVCKPYAPMYRQVTLTGLRRALAPGGPGAALLTSGLQYDDVKDAWNYYLQNDNHGRGVVIVGHSQGAMILTELIRNEIDGKPVQKQIVSAILLGTSIPVPKGKDVGGAFKQFPLCKSAAQTGCLITYASFRSTIPPPANTLFGRVAGEGMVSACTNPANLSGGSGELKSYLSASGSTITGRTPPRQWVTPEKPITTPWVSVPGLLTAQCASNENATGYLQITVHGDPSDPRTDDIGGDLGMGQNVQANWGLHLVDVDLAMGNLIDIVGQQAKAYGGRN